MSNRQFSGPAGAAPLPVSGTALLARLGFSTNTAPGVLARLRRAMQVRRERNLLLQLDDRQLKDIGLSRADAEGEAGRGLFELPRRPARYY
jgi:uncharacterized protein YjiS (DUF1127 family)